MNPIRLSLFMGEILRLVYNINSFHRDKSFSGHSFTHQESIAVSTAEIEGATAYEVTGKISFLSH